MTDDKRDMLADVAVASQAEQVATKRLFELYVDEIVGEEAAAREALIVKLRWFEGDIDLTVQRLGDDPGAALALVNALSHTMQLLDQEAGAVTALGDSVRYARRWALLIPDTQIHS